MSGYKCGAHLSQLQILLVSAISVYNAHKISVLHSNLSATIGKTRAVLSKDIDDKFVDLPKTNSKKFGEEVTAVHPGSGAACKILHHWMRIILRRVWTSMYTCTGLS